MIAAGWTGWMSFLAWKDKALIGGACPLFEEGSFTVFYFTSHGDGRRRLCTTIYTSFIKVTSQSLSDLCQAKVGDHISLSNLGV